MTEAKISPLVGMIDTFGLHAPVPLEDRAAMLELPYVSRFFEAGSYLVRDGDISDHCGVLVSGLAYRHKVSGEGLRQIVSILIPGEMFDLQCLYLETADHNVQTLMRSEVITIPRAALRNIAADRPFVAQAFVASLLVELAAAREWMLNIGRRDARARLAHFLCELAVRLNRQGFSPGQSYTLPMTQEQLGDATGLTAVHINRTLKVLIREGLLSYVKYRIIIPDIEELARVADFNSRYLHMNLPH